MIDSKNNMKVLEYNCRLGDPETQNIIMTLQNKNIDLLDLILNEPKADIKDLNLDKLEEPNNESCCTIVLAADGYPGKYVKDFYIDLSDIKESKKIKVFHAGTKLVNNKIVAIGGRLLSVNVYADTKAEALEIAYENIKKIKIFEDEGLTKQNQKLVFYREDIGA